MSLALIVLAVLAVALFGFGFVMHALWWIAVVAAIVFVIALVRGPRRSVTRF